MKEPIKLDTFEGHLVLICKGHYLGENDFFDALKRFWAVRCGVGEFTHDSVFENIADTMYEIMEKTSPGRMKYFHQVLHRDLTDKFFEPEYITSMSAIKRVVWSYRDSLMQLQINDIIDGKTVNLINLPEEQKQILKRVCNGNGRYKDYDKLVKADKRV